MILRASIKKYIDQELVFRWGLLLRIVSSSTMLVTFFLVNRFYGDQFVEHLGQLKTSYFGYVTLGLAVCELSDSCLGSLIGQLNQEKANQVFQQIMSSPVSIHTWAISVGICNLIGSLFRFFMTFCIAIFIFKLQLPTFDGFAFIFILALSVLPLWSVGLLAMSSSLVFRRGNVFNFIFMLGVQFLGGVYVPQSVLPSWIRPLAEIFPITPIIRSMQRIVYSGGHLSQVMPDLTQVIILTCIYFPLALFALKKADQLSRKNGYYCLT